MLAIICDSQTQWNSLARMALQRQSLTYTAVLQQIHDMQIVKQSKTVEFSAWIFDAKSIHRKDTTAHEERVFLLCLFSFICYVSRITFVSVIRQTYRIVKSKPKSKFSIHSFESDFWDSFFVSLEKMACTLICKVLKKCQAIWKERTHFSIVSVFSSFAS